MTSYNNRNNSSKSRMSRTVSFWEASVDQGSNVFRRLNGLLPSDWKAKVKLPTPLGSRSMDARGAKWGAASTSGPRLHSGSLTWCKRRRKCPWYAESRRNLWCTVLISQVNDVANDNDSPGTTANKFEVFVRPLNQVWYDCWCSIRETLARESILGKRTRTPFVTAHVSKPAVSEVVFLCLFLCREPFRWI